MTKILDLAKKFQQTSETEVQNTSEVVKNAIKQHEKDLIGQLNNAKENIAENIQVQQSTLIRAVTIKMFSLPIILSTLILTILLVVNLWLMWDAQNQYQEAKEWKASAEIYKQQAHKMKLSNCKLTTGEIKPCIAVDLNYINQNWDKNLKIIEEN